MKKRTVAVAAVVLLCAAGIPLFAHSYGDHAMRGHRNAGRDCPAYCGGEYSDTYRGTQRSGDMNSPLSFRDSTGIMGTIKSVDMEKQIIEIVDADNAVRKIRVNPMTRITSVSAQVMNDLRNGNIARGNAQSSVTAIPLADIKAGYWVRVSAYAGDTENLDARSIMVMVQ